MYPSPFVLDGEKNGTNYKNRLNGVSNILEYRCEGTSDVLKSVIGSVLLLNYG